MSRIARTAVVFALAAGWVVAGQSARGQFQNGRGNLGFGGAGTGFGGPIPAAQPAEKATVSSVPREDFMYEQLAELVTQGKMTSLEQVLPQLPREIRAGFILMGKSKSSHQATLQYPRVILCSPSAQLMVAYSTAHTDENRSVLEVIQWRQATETFEFREIAFDPKGRKPPVFSEANPGRCAACHGDSLRPNWEPASIWPGAIGGGKEFEQQEVKQLWHLSRRSEPRLKVLTWSPVFESTETPAARMAHHLNVLNTRRMSRFFRESRDYELYKYAIVAGLLGLPEFLDVEPMRTASLERPTDFRQLLKETRGTLTELLAKYYAPDDGQAIANVRYIFEPRKISLRDVTTSNRSPFMLTGDMKTDFGDVVLQLYETDIELRQQAPLPLSRESMFAAGAERQLLSQRLKEASQRAWERRTGVSLEKPRT